MNSVVTRVNKPFTMLSIVQYNILKYMHLFIFPYLFRYMSMLIKPQMITQAIYLLLILF